jgi:hypothetical protein
MNDIQLTLLAAKTLVSYPKDLAQDYFAKDKWGAFVDWESPSAVSWCVAGSVFAVAPDVLTRDIAFDVVRQASFKMFGECPTVVNDTLPHSAMMDMFDVAIELAA